MLLQQSVDEGLIGDFSVHKVIAAMAFEILRVGAVAGIFKRVKIHDPMAAIEDQPSDEMRADEPRATGDENVHSDKEVIPRIA